MKLEKLLLKIYVLENINKINFNDLKNATYPAFRLKPIVDKLLEQKCLQKNKDNSITLIDDGILELNFLKEVFQKKQLFCGSNVR